MNTVSYTHLDVYKRQEREREREREKVGRVREKKGDGEWEVVERDWVGGIVSERVISG